MPVRLAAAQHLWIQAKPPAMVTENLAAEP